MSKYPGEEFPYSEAEMGKKVLRKMYDGGGALLGRGS